MRTASFRFHPRTKGVTPNRASALLFLVRTLLLIGLLVALLVLLIPLLLALLTLLVLLILRLVGIVLLLVSHGCTLLVIFGDARSCGADAESRKCG